MATKYNSKFTGEQIDNSVETVVSNTATDGQVLTANGTGGATWQNASGGTQLYYHDLLFGNEQFRVLSTDNKAYTSYRLNVILTKAIIIEYGMERFLVLSSNSVGIGKTSFVYLSETTISTSATFTLSASPDSDTVTPL